MRSRGAPGHERPISAALVGVNHRCQRGELLHQRAGIGLNGRMARTTGIQLGFDEGTLRAAAGATSFGRGEDYVGAVSGLDIGDGTIRATVPGRETYRVELVVTRR